jgi:hypothetical protein
LTDCPNACAAVLEPDHPRALECTRELLLCLHHMPTYKRPIVGSHASRLA